MTQLVADPRLKAEPRGCPHFGQERRASDQGSDRLKRTGEPRGQGLGGKMKVWSRRVSHCQGEGEMSRFVSGKKRNWISVSILQSLPLCSVGKRMWALSKPG